MNGEADAYIQWLVAITTQDPKKRTRTPPPTLSIPLTEALDEIRMMNEGYVRRKDMDYMTTFSARLRMIASKISAAESKAFRMM